MMPIHPKDPWTEAQLSMEAFQAMVADANNATNHQVQQDELIETDE